MQSLTDGEVLKKLRKLRGISQKQCCQGIVSRHTYSRIERNQTTLQFYVLLELLKRLNTSYDDFLFFKQERNSLNFFVKKYSFLTKKNIQEDKIIELYSYLQENKDGSIQQFHYYLLFKKHMEELNFDQIEKIDTNDLNRLNTYINNLTFFSMLDLALFSDLCDYLMYDIAKTAILKITKQINNYKANVDFTQNQQHFIHRSLCSITSVAISNQDYDFVKYLLKKTKNFLYRFPNHYFLLFLHFNTHTLNYKLTANDYYLTKLFVLKDCMNELEDYQVANKIENQIKLLLQHSSMSPLDY